MDFQEFKKRFDELEVYYETEEGKARVAKIIADIRKREKRKERWLNWLRTNDNQFEHIMSKLDEERHKALKWLILDYVREVGEFPTRKQRETYSNSFTAEMYVYKGYMFNLMHGQGSHLKIEKLTT